MRVGGLGVTREKNPGRREEFVEPLDEDFAGVTTAAGALPDDAGLLVASQAALLCEFGFEVLGGGSVAFAEGASVGFF